jgi:amino acid transporter
MIPQKELSLFDSICIIVGIVIGVGIYESTPTVAASMGEWKGTLGVWLAGGLLALTGALCYAELATTYPHQGGDYVYLSRAYGSWAGYLFGWSQLMIIRPGDIALVAFVFARYAQTLYTPIENALPLYAASAIFALTVINILGAKEGKWAQNILTMTKSIGLLLIVTIGFLAPGPPSAAGPSEITTEGFKLALILVLWTFGGWNEMAYVAAEVKRPERNIVRSLVMGTLLVTAMYVLINGAFFHALGQNKMGSSRAIAVDTLSTVFPGTAGRLISVIVCLSALGGVNGLIFTGARISYALGSEHTAFRGIGRWNQRFGTPVWGLIVQGAISLAMVIVAGSFIDTILYTAPAVWLFFVTTGVSVFVLRRRDPHILRPYKISVFPIPAIIFCAFSFFMLYSSVTYALAVKPIGLIIVSSVLLMGVIVYWFMK